MSDKSRTWRLFVDESGSFENPADPVVVGGLLVPDGHGGLDGLATRLRRTLPDVPWPLHRAHLQQPFYMPAVSLGRERPPADDLFVRAVRLVEGRRPDLVRDLRQAARQGRRLEIGDLRAAAEILGETDEGGEVLDLLRAGARRSLAAISEALREFTRAEDGLEFVTSVHAAEEMPTAEGRADEATGTRRYLGLLELLFRRAGRSIARHPGAHRLRCNVLVRGIWHPELGTHGPLRTRDVQSCLDRALEHLSRVDGIADPVLPYGADLGGGWVAADFLAGAARLVLSRPHELRRAERSVTRLGGVEPRSPALDVPQLAASGSCQRRIEAATDAVPPPTAPDALRWARGQADEWTALLRSEAGLP